MQTRLLKPLMGLLKQGTSPDKLAWSVASAFAIALFPIVGPTTMLCIFVGQVFRLSQVAMQTVNYLLFPAQILLAPGFVRIGDAIFGVKTVSFNPLELRAQFSAGAMQFLEKFGVAGLHAVVAWALILPVPTFLLAKVLRSVFERVNRRARPELQ